MSGSFKVRPVSVCHDNTNHVASDNSQQKRPALQKHAVQEERIQAVKYHGYNRVTFPYRDIYDTHCGYLWEVVRRQRASDHDSCSRHNAEINLTDATDTRAIILTTGSKTRDFEIQIQGPLLSIVISGNLFKLTLKLDLILFKIFRRFQLLIRFERTTFSYRRNSISCFNLLWYLIQQVKKQTLPAKIQLIPQV